MRKTRTFYSDEFKRQVINDFFEQHLTEAECARKWEVRRNTVQKWVNSCKYQEKGVTLHTISLKMDANEHVLQDLRAENDRLNRALALEHMKVVAYERLLEIVKLEDGIDLLKKGGAKQ